MQKPKVLKEWLTEPTVAPKWLIPGLVPADSFCLVSGPQKKAFKTYFTMAVAIAAANQLGVGGRFAPAEEMHSVLIVEEEGAQEQTKTRFKAIAAGMGLQPHEVSSHIYIHHRARVRLNDRLQTMKLQQQIKELQPKLVIWDAFANLLGGDENSVKEVMTALNGIQDMRAWGASQMVICHTRKPPRKGPWNEGEVLDPDDELRGSTAIAGIYDRHFALRTEEFGGKNIALKLLSRDYEPEQLAVSWDILTSKEKIVQRATMRITDAPEEEEWGEGSKGKAAA